MGNIPTNTPQSLDVFIKWVQQELESEVYAQFLDKQYLKDALSELDNYYVSQ